MCDVQYRMRLCVLMMLRTVICTAYLQCLTRSSGCSSCGVEDVVATQVGERE